MAYNNLLVRVIIPAYNEASSIARVINDVPTFVDEILVVCNGSTDETIQRAIKAGANVIKEPNRGYGSACLAGARYILDKPTDIIVFLDGDYSDYPEEMEKLLAPIVESNFDLVIGSRVLGHHKKGALLPQQIFGNHLAVFFIKLFYGFKYTDLGPFRAITKSAFEVLGMKDKDFGWTVEMQIKAIKNNIKTKEVPVSYRPRIGQSKISGTLKGSIKAGYKILHTIYKYL